LKPLAFQQALSMQHDSFLRDMWGLEQELRRSLPTRWIWKAAAVVSGLFIISSGAISFYIWRSPVAPSVALEIAYSKVGNFACFAEAEYPDSWRAEAPLCAPYGCNFGKMSEDACLALAARKGSKTVIHGDAGTSRTDECWLQNSCGNLQPHYEFTMFKM
jgi:hypothetical protein